MILKCIKTNKSGSLSIEKLYEVVAVYVNLHDRSLSFNLVDDFGRLAFYEENLFEFDNNRFDSDWVIKKLSNELFAFLPESLSYDSFYEDFHNDEVQAKEKFKLRYPTSYEQLFFDSEIDHDT